MVVVEHEEEGDRSGGCLVDEFRNQGLHRRQLGRLRWASRGVEEIAGVCGGIGEHFGLDPLEVRLMNAARKGTLSSYGPTFSDIGLVATLEAAMRPPRMTRSTAFRAVRRGRMRLKP